MFRFRRFRAASAAARSRPLAEDCHSPQARCCLRSAAGRTECVRSAGFDPNENSRVSACRSPPPLAADGRPRVARCPPAAVGELPMCGSSPVRRHRRRRAGASSCGDPLFASAPAFLYKLLPEGRTNVRAVHRRPLRRTADLALLVALLPPSANCLCAAAPRCDVADVGGPELRRAKARSSHKARGRPLASSAPFFIPSATLRTSSLR